ncbi:MAG: hypothetical protein KGJ35_01315 [Patescibacteria group bacterium]|nr:hypothetical protein [Patescibacteria group bacterium]
MYVLILLSCTLIVSQAFKKRYTKWERRRQAFENSWKDARKKRIEWKEDHAWLDFDHPEYQSLWESEIGAEDLYLMYIGRTSPSISWSDYCAERSEAEHDDS